MKKIELTNLSSNNSFSKGSSYKMKNHISFNNKKVLYCFPIIRPKENERERETEERDEKQKKDIGIVLI